MRDKCLEALIVVACKIIYRESSEACAYASKSVLINIRERASIIDSREIVVDTLTGPVARNLFTPFATEARKTATVWSYDYITISSHNLEVPTVRPELAYWALRTTLTEQKGRVLLIRVKV